ncbi:chaperone protein DnaK [Candidatus Methanoplasma termitum]|uniref:DnaK2 protein n=1 Tax=Candidatus Methanoplasma termitum TaxID=1577791 RepID=A0A0A7LGA9_9ARCH|nr:Hsp70 family protein [Candidatus Methanoplasma termitum]AIZ56531.1 chaperone protein DnaK [Candidatus Methanoplasma termitum]MCL2333398.1 Hsp70 family protein [Candidatus Methanoplasma sp.]
MKVGIDLGTTYSTVARYDKKTSRPEVINNQFEKELTPSVICFLDNGEILIGEDAKDMQAGGAGTIAASFKRGMGDNSFTVEANGKVYTAEDLSAMLLKKLITDAEAKVKEKIDSVVITVPAYFNDFQRTATIRAGEACGVKVMKIINEPTSAAISYGYTRESNKTVLVYDLGGGTFDVTLVKINKGNIQVIGTDGNHLLGGKDWDATIVKFACEQFLEEFGVDPRDDESAKNELIVASENYKKVLTKSDSVAIQIKYEGYSGKYVLRREQFDMRTQFLLNATNDVCMKLFNDLGKSWKDVDEILLVGGSTRMPQVPKFLEMVSGRPVIDHADTDLAVAKGAAITAELYCGTHTGVREVQIADVTAHSLGALAESPGGDRYINEIMIKRNSKVPSSVKKPFKISPGNPTDVIEVYTLQGESKIPLDCYVLAKVVITGFYNDGNGALIDIEYTYDENGVVKVSAYQDGERLEVVSEPVPEDISWMGGSPSANTTGGPVMKNVVLCIDLSRSMRNSLEEVKNHIRDFVIAAADENTKIGLIGFGDKVGIMRDMTGDTNTIITALDSLKVNVYGRGTDASPMGTAMSMMANRPGGKMIVILTDGIWGKRDFAVSEALSCRNANVAVVGLGIGEADISFLKQISTVEEGAMFTTLDRLGESFSKIARALNSGSMGMRESSGESMGRLGSAEVKGRLR